MGSGFRTDIEGLRALAITLVVLFHADVPGFGGGFVGVDVFFVLSGYLITTKLVTELRTDGRVDLRRFWLGRGKRLLPAACTMIAVTVSAQMLIRNPILWRKSIAEGIAATFYVSNEYFARTSEGYFDNTFVERALLHTWSLSVEEQFYIAFPLLLWLVGPKLRRVRIAVGVIALGSLIVSAVQSANSPGLAYLLAASRAWEFLAGAALAMATVTFGLKTDRARHTAAALALISIVVSAVLTTKDSNFPFPLAIVPVGATAVLIVSAVGPDSRVGRLLAVRPMQFIGRLSYSWYLWHWPVLVLGIEVLGREDLALRVALAIGSLAPALVSFYVIENPIRRLQPDSLPRFALIGVFAPIAVAVGAIFTVTYQEQAVFEVPETLALREAKNDLPWGVLFCTSPDIAHVEETCIGGNPDADETVLLFGDSHASHWYEAMNVIGQEEDLRVVLTYGAACPTFVTDRDELDEDCRAIAESFESIVTHLDPALVVMSHSDVYDIDSMRWEAGLSAIAEQLGEQDRSLLIVHDVPRFPEDPVLCLVDVQARSDDDEDRCAIDRSMAESRAAPVRAVERSVVARYPNVFSWDPLDVICEPTVCRAQTPEGVRFLDAHHLTQTFSGSLAGDLKPSVLDGLQHATSGGNR